MNWWNLLRIGECTLKNIVGNFWIMQFLGETIEFFLIYIYLCECVCVCMCVFEIFEC